VELASDVGFTAILDSASELASSSWTATVSLAPSDNTTYYWRYAAKSAGSYGSWSATQQVKVWVVGKAGPAGGIVFYDAGSQQGWGRWLECAPADVDGGNPKVWWNGTAIGIPSAKETGIGTGKANTEAIVAAQGAGSYAASLCQAYSLNGFSDWFLPSKDELNLMYMKLKVSGLGSFAAHNYWSSSQGDTYKAWNQYFDNDFQYNSNTYSNFLVRAVRAF
jgi:hypothetical protein